MATKDRSGRAQCQSNKTENIDKTIAKATEEHGRSENSAVLHDVWRQKAMVPRKVRTLGVQRLADLATLPDVGDRGPNASTTKVKGRIV